MNDESLTENSSNPGVIITSQTLDQNLSSKNGSLASLGESQKVPNGQKATPDNNTRTDESVINERRSTVEHEITPSASAESTPVNAAASKEQSTNSLSYSYPPPPGTSDSPTSDPTTPPSLPYPPTTPHLTRAPVSILTKDPTLGRGVFASEDIPVGQVVEISPVLVLSEKEYRGFDPKKEENEGNGELRGVEASQLRGYVFTWGKNGDMAVALGLGSLFNHSPSPNVSYEIKQSEYTIHYRAAKPIKAGQELFIFYGHSVRFAGDPLLVPASETEDAIDDGWGGLGGLEGEEEGGDVGRFKEMTPEQLKERDLEVIGFEEPDFPFRKITEIIDPEDAELTTFPCLAIDLPARHSGIIFQFVRKHTSRKFNELQHLKRVRPIQQPSESNGSADPSPTSSLPPPVPLVNDSNDPQSEEPQRKGTLAADTLVSILLFPVATAPPNLLELLSSSPLTSALSPDPIPELYTVDVPAQAAHTERQAEEWNKVWPVTLVHIREGPKATMKKKGWERAKMEWIEREIEKVWDKAKEAGQRGENPIACHVTDSWSPNYHTSLRPPATLVTAFDTRISTSNCLSHAASNAIDAVSVLDLHDARPKLSPEAFDPPYVLTGLTVFSSHEPCLLCAMSLLHSRIGQLYYVKSAPGSGGCGSLYKVHEDGGLNHRYEVWEWVHRESEGNIGKGIEELRIDP
ncbi:hypothetical protein JCM16303_005018 [Sporobolomyces ruberrimus]